MDLKGLVAPPGVSPVKQHWCQAQGEGILEWAEEEEDCVISYALRSFAVLETAACSITPFLKVSPGLMRILEEVESTAGSGADCNGHLDPLLRTLIFIPYCWVYWLEWSSSHGHFALRSP